MSAQTIARVFTPEQVAQMWGCSDNHVRNLIKRGELKAFRLGNKLIRIPADALAEYQTCQITASDASKSDTSSRGGRMGSESVIVLKHSMPRMRKERR